MERVSNNTLSDPFEHYVHTPIRGGRLPREFVKSFHQAVTHISKGGTVDDNMTGVRKAGKKRKPYGIVAERLKTLRLIK